MITFEDLLASVKGTWKPVVAVAVAQDDPVLSAIRRAYDAGIADAILVGDEPEIIALAHKNGICLEGFSIVHESDKVEACRIAVSLIKEGRAQVLMKGLVDTAVILKAVLDKTTGIRASDILSHVGVFELDTFDRFLYVTDAAMNMYPDVMTKKAIIKNALTVANALGNHNPIVACLAAIEKVNPKMQATVDADELMRLNTSGELKGCFVVGPLALDNALSVEAAKHKGISDPCAGRADILLVPQIEAGNVLYKSFTILGHAKSAGIVIGASVPVIVTSRSDSDDTKFNSIALAIRMALCSRIME